MKFIAVILKKIKNNNNSVIKRSICILNMKHGIQTDCHISLCAIKNEFKLPIFIFSRNPDVQCTEIKSHVNGRPRLSVRGVRGWEGVTSQGEGGQTMEGAIKGTRPAGYFEVIPAEDLWHCRGIAGQVGKRRESTDVLRER